MSGRDPLSLCATSLTLVPPLPGLHPTAAGSLGASTFSGPPSSKPQCCCCAGARGARVSGEPGPRAGRLFPLLRLW